MPKNALPSPAPPAALSDAAPHRPAPAAGAGSAARLAAAAKLLRRLAAAWNRAGAGSSAVAEAHRQGPEWHLLAHHRHMVR